MKLLITLTCECCLTGVSSKYDALEKTCVSFTVSKSPFFKIRETISCIHVVPFDVEVKRKKN